MKYTIDELVDQLSLSPDDRKSVLDEYGKRQHPIQIEYQVWSHTLPMILAFALLIYLKMIKNVDFDINSLKLFIWGIVGSLIYGYLLRIVEVNLIAPKVIRTILDRLKNIKRNRTTGSIGPQKPSTCA